MRPDISASLFERVEPPEHQPILDGAQLRQALLVEARERIALGAVLVGARRSSSPDGDQLAFGAVAQLIEPGVQPVDVLLLADELGLYVGHRTPSDRASPPIVRRLPYLPDVRPAQVTNV